MTVFRCDFKVPGVLALEEWVKSCIFNSLEQYKIIFRNGESNNQGHAVDLVVSVIGPTTSLD